MEPDAPLDYMLDQPTGPRAGREELHAIVARSGRRRTRITAAGMAATLVIGGAAGWAVRSGRTGGGTPVAAQAPTSTTVPAYQSPAATGESSFASGGAVSGSAVASPAGPMFTMTKKFTRTTADGVTIRGYQHGPDNAPPVLKGSCGIMTGFTAEVSTADVAGQVGGGGFSLVAPTSPFLSIGPSTIGVLESAPVSVIMIRTEASVTEVRVVFADGKTDQMAPVDGWSVLAHLAPAAQASGSAGTAEALDASGKVLGTSPVPSAPVPLKLLPPPAVGKAPAAPGNTGAVASGSVAPVAPAAPTTVAGKPGAPVKPCVFPAPAPVPAPGAPSGVPLPKGGPLPPIGAGGSAFPAICGC